MQLLEELTAQGFKLIPLGKDQLGVTPKDRLTDELRQRIRANKGKILEALRNQHLADEYLTKGKAEENDSHGCERPFFRDSRYCEGYNPPRAVHLEACQWHCEQADPHCANCKHLTVEQQKLWMDTYLDKAIARLNALYKEGDHISWGKRKMVDELEAEITKAFLAYDLEKFKELVDQWEVVFNQMRQSRNCNTQGKM